MRCFMAGVGPMKPSNERALVNDTKESGGMPHANFKILIIQGNCMFKRQYQ